MTAQPTPQQPYGGAAAEDPGKTLGIVSIVLAFFVAPGGIITGYLSRKASREAGLADNQLGKIGFILGIVFTILGVIVTIIYIVAIAALMGSGNYPG